ncbi:MAG: peptidylprolyl isomerase [Planctomycetales bacterium]|nr:peptidylprolyl isomerase [Planctomycetales bacterium]NIM09633.1 peptidylprolyl isomerase [Planctomycetales bacterium]NIN09116.1 peptidylprolyl isomerase [Planctomycetales bacterium]NIN78223.1 peptidylprolyl isomerase [Planctomycetales bacterium]NIO35414.1 peptidylprolyl isomerase [Planctomycetales bacterium]
MPETRHARPQSRSTFYPPRNIALLVGGACVLIVCAAIRFTDGVPPADAKPPAAAATDGSKTSMPPTNPLAAQVNGQKITRVELGRECLKRHGEQVLEAVISRKLIELECRQHGISITAEEVQQEIENIAGRFGLPVDQWMMLLRNERNISAEQYSEEIVWPMLALRRLAASQLAVSEAEIQKEIESQFGPQVQVRMIVIDQRQKADQVRTAAITNPDEFARLAAKHSTDINSASAGGLVQPIRRHMGDPEIERTAFALRPGQISPIIPVGEQYVLLKCEDLLPARQPGKAQLQQLRTAIVDNIRDRKLRQAGTELFAQLKKNARVENVLNHPQKSQQQPGVAATLNGHPVTMAELQNACIARHGKQVLENMINRALLQTEMAKARLQVTQQELNQEVIRAAIDAGFTHPDGTADLEKWIQTITQENEITQDTYLTNMVWPTVALKKLVGKVTVSDEEIQKGFEANYGPRVRCRAIIVDNLRRAQEAWNLARRDPRIENFAELAAQYSVDAASRSIGGVVPPIQRHGGQPALEREAFALQPGELSGVIQVADKFVILLCEEITKPVVVELAEVRDLLYQDLLEKKHRLAMAQHFEKLLAAARITNFLDPDASRTPSADTTGQAKSRPSAARG